MEERGFAFAVTKYVEAPVEWLARAPCSPREALLILNTASRARCFEKTFQVYVELAKRKKGLDGAWRRVAGLKDLETNAMFHFLSEMLRASKEARIKVLEDLSETTDALVQYSEELSKFSNVNRASAERLKRRSRSVGDEAMRKALEEEFFGRHTLAECEREIAKRIKDITQVSCGGEGQKVSSLESLSDFLHDLESRHGVKVAGKGPEEVPDSQEDREWGGPDTLTVRGGIQAAKRQRVSETPTPPFHSGTLASNSSDDSRKTPNLTPNQTAVLRPRGTSSQPAESPLGRGNAKKLDSNSKQGRSPWATPGTRRGKDAGERKGKKAKVGEVAAEVGCVLNFDDAEMANAKPPQKVKRASLSNSASLGVTPSPTLTAST